MFSISKSHYFISDRHVRRYFPFEDEIEWKEVVAKQVDDNVRQYPS